MLPPNSYVVLWPGTKISSFGVLDYKVIAYTPVVVTKEIDVVPFGASSIAPSTWSAPFQNKKVQMVFLVPLLPNTKVRLLAKTKLKSWAVSEHATDKEFVLKDKALAFVLADSLPIASTSGSVPSVQTPTTVPSASDLVWQSVYRVDPRVYEEKSFLQKFWWLIVPALGVGGFLVYRKLRSAEITARASALSGV